MVAARACVTPSDLDSEALERSRPRRTRPSLSLSCITPRIGRPPLFLCRRKANVRNGTSWLTLVGGAAAVFAPFPEWTA